MAPKTKDVSKAVFADEIDVSRPRVSQLVRDGLPVNSDGTINLAKGKRWVARHLDQHRREARKPSHASGATTTETRSAKLGWEARLRELEFQKRSGELIDRALVERVIFERASLERDKWLGWIPRTVANLASEADIDPARIFAVLDRLVRDHLTELAATPVKEMRGD